MILYPSGARAVVSCDLRKDGKTAQISLNGVVSFSVDKGRWWRSSNGTITTVSRRKKLSLIVVVLLLCSGLPSARAKTAKEARDGSTVGVYLENIDS